MTPLSKQELRKQIQDYAVDFHNSFKPNYPAPDLDALMTSVDAYSKQREVEAELVGIAKILDNLWDNSYYSMGEAASKRIERELIYHFGENWPVDMYEFAGIKNHPEIPTLATLAAPQPLSPEQRGKP